MLDEYIRFASISEGDMADGRYAELESRYLDTEGKVEKNRDEMSDRKRKAIAIGRFMDELKAHDGVRVRRKGTEGTADVFLD